MESLTGEQRAYIADMLRRLHDHYHEWAWVDGAEYDLAAFAYYEGCGDSSCCGDLLAEAAPIALGAELVARHGFAWVSLAQGRLGVTHPALAESIDLALLEDGSWNEEEYDEPPCRGKMTLDSLETIMQRVRKNLRGAEQHR